MEKQICDVTQAKYVSAYWTSSGVPSRVSEANCEKTTERKRKQKARRAEWTRECKIVRTNGAYTSIVIGVSLNEIFERPSPGSPILPNWQIFRSGSPADFFPPWGVSGTHRNTLGIEFHFGFWKQRIATEKEPRRNNKTRIQLTKLHWNEDNAKYVSRLDNYNE